MMTSGTYEFFDHTGDFGVEISAPTAAVAAALAARAFLDLLTEDPGCVRENESVRIEVKGVDRADCLVGLGNELLFLFETEGFLCARFEPTEVGDGSIRGIAHGERFDPGRHPIARPLKAVTHHGACFEEDGDGVRARLIYDL